MNYNFALNIQDDNDSLSPTNGLGFGELGILITNLDGAIKVKDGGKATLYQVSNHGYTPCFTTENKSVYQNFVEVHQNIYEKGYSDLNKHEASYANALKTLLKGKTYIEALDSNHKPIQRIYPSEIEKSVDSFCAITTITGIISEIGSQKLEATSHIYLHGLGYKIYISKEQDKELRPHYKQSIIECKIKQRRSIKTNKIINAVLISTKVKSELNFTESMALLTNDDLSFLGDFKSIEDFIRTLRP